MNILDNNYNDLKKYVDTVLNTDKSTFKNSNDEPTPMPCVEEMLSKIPDNFFKRDNLQILDPCCGNGNFHLRIYYLLRAHHSHEDSLGMLYFNDINVDRLDNVRQIFPSANVSDVDFLDSTVTRTFDLIVANPPYASFSKDNKRASKNHNLIQKFLQRSLDSLKPDGLLLFITPNNWMSLSDRNMICEQLTQLQILYLNLGTAKKYFPKIGSSFTWYLVQNTLHSKQEDSTILIEGIWRNKTYSSIIPSQKISFIPLIYTSEVYSIINKTINIEHQQNEVFPIETTSFLHKHTKRDFIVNEYDKDHPYRLIHTPTQTVFSSIKHKYQDGYKVFISLTSTYKIYIDNCGMTQSIAFIRCTSLQEAEYIRDILSHDLYIFLNNICRWGNFNNVRILQKFPIPYDKDIYKYFNISPDEINFIKSIILDR